MLHRPADSRLLSNLLSHEKEYARALHSQFDYGQSSLSSFSAYAAASPPPISRAIGSVATALAGAQDALRGYVLAVEEWCGQLKMLKDLEDEVGMIARDREILVDRLIKASKTNNPKRRSILPSSSSNHQGSSVFSTSHSSLEHLQASFSNSKLELAQNELQACETHLTEKERLLVQMRESAVVGGLKVRCKALVECGWKWTEVGKSGLMALDSSPSRGPMDQHGLFEKPLPDVNYPYQPAPSDLSSSLGPSQSASQIFHGDAVSEQHVPSNSSSPGLRGHVPNSETHASSQYALDLPPAHAISEEDHYIPPRARVQESVEDEAGGSSLEDETEDRQYEVHDNPLFSHPLSAKLNSKKAGSKTGLHLKRSNRQDSKSAAIMPSSVSAPLPTTQTSKEHAQRHNNDHYGTSSSINTYSDGHQESSRNRKRSTFLGISALTGIFHKRERSASMSAESSNDPFSIRSPPSPKKGGFWHTRTDKNIKKSGKDDDSSDDDGERRPVRTSPIPSYLTHVAGPKTSPESRPRTTEEEGISARPKHIPSTGRKLRKVSDGDAHRKASGSEDTQTPRPASERRDSAAKMAKEKDGRSESRGNGNGNGYISPLSSPSVSRSSTVRSASTVKTSPPVRPARPASVDLASSGPRGRRTALSDAGHTGRGKGHRRTTSLSHVSTPPTHGQTSLLSIVEDVTRQNRQGWLHTNPNSLLIEIKAPKSVYQAAEEPVVSANNQQTNSDTTFDYAARRESPLRHELVNGLRGSSIAASSSEPSLPLKLLPPTPSPLQRAPLRSALRNRSASPNPATLSPPRTASPMRSTASSLSGGGTAPAGLSKELKGTTLSPLKDNDSESLSSVYETGQEDFDSDPPTPRGREEEHVLPNGNALQSTANGSQISEDASSTGGTATPPSRRKSVRVSLKPTFSPTPPALADYEDDHSPWASGPSSPPDEQVHSGWISRKAENDGWEDSSDEDEEYSQARKMLLKASRKLEKISRGG